RRPVVLQYRLSQSRCQQETKKWQAEEFLHSHRLTGMKYSTLRPEKQMLREKTVFSPQSPVFSQQSAVRSRQSAVWWRLRRHQSLNINVHRIHGACLKESKCAIAEVIAAIGRRRAIHAAVTVEQVVKITVKDICHAGKT